jgi:hypothetical protein
MVLCLVVGLEVVDVGGVHVRKVVVKPQAQLDLALLCEHDLGRRHAAEVHPCDFIELR